MIKFSSTNLWIERVKYRDLDSFYRVVFATMKESTDEELNRSMIYAYQKVLATKMRHEGFKFRPVFRINRNEGSLNKCDYGMSLDITGKHLQIEINLK